MLCSIWPGRVLSGMSDAPHQLEQLAATGAWDGPRYRYRGAEPLLDDSDFWDARVFPV